MVVGVTEVNVKQHVHTGVGHVLAPKELAHGGARAPQGEHARGYAVAGEHVLYQAAVCRAADALYGTQGEVAAQSRPVALGQEAGQVGLAHHGG